jgi:diguanylate cyclase (GGDEF)-like protein/PAS domain S-box-containing protein
MRFQVFDLANYAFNPYAIPTSLAAAAVLLLAVWVLVRERGAPVGVSLFLVSLSIAVWFLAFSLMYSSKEKQTAFWWARAAYLGVPFIPSTLYSFAVTSLRTNARRRGWIWGGLAASAIFSVCAVETDALIIDLYRYRWGFYPKYGWLGVPFMAFFFTMLGSSVYEYVSENRRRLGLHRTPMRILLIAFGVASLGSFDFLAKFGIPLYPFGYFPVLVFLFIIARTIQQHGWVDLTPSFAAREIISTMSDPLIVCDLEGRIRFVNDSTCTVLGYSERELRGRTIGDLVDVLPAERNQLHHRMLEEGARDREMAFWTKAGESIELSVSVSMLRDWSQVAVGIVVIGRDIGRRKEAEERLREANQALEALIASSPLAIFTMDPGGCLKLWNPAAERIFGWGEREVLGRQLPIVPEERQDEFRGLMNRVLQGDGFTDVEAVRLKKDGSPIDVSISAAPLYDAKGGINGVMAVVADITDRKRTAERLDYLANYDPLTGLPNRTLFSDRLSQALARANRHRQSVAVFYLALDRFKVINDTIGRDFGDLLLKGAAERLKACLREGDTVARLGGEFTLIITDVGQTQDVAKIAQKIIDTLAKPFQLGEHEVFIHASIGISFYPNDGDDPEALLRNADAAMYQAKEQGRNYYRLYSPDMNTKTLDRLALENRLHKALERGEFLVYYQAQVELGTGQIVGMEALIRWKQSDGEVVPPVKFIPAAEETGLIVPIGEWVLRTACAQNKAWQESGLPPVRVGVNLSARQFHQADLIDSVARVLKETGLGPNFLELELTESILMQKEETIIAMVRELNQMGIRLAIDDFGTGYSSLSYLKRFPINKLKIDKSFVRSALIDSNDAIIARTIVGMAHSLRLKAIAEGVETVGQFQFFRSIQCDEIQGNLFSLPLSSEEATKLLAEGKVTLPRAAP